MGWIIRLSVDAGGPDRVYLDCLRDWNYTYNTDRMLREACFGFGELRDQLAGDCLPGLHRVIHEFEADPVRFRALAPANNWGSYDGLLVKLRELVEAFEAAPKARVLVL